MKKVILIALLFVIQTASALALESLPYAPIGRDPRIGTLPITSPCVSRKIVINKMDPVDHLGIIRDNLVNYKESSRGFLSLSGRYELCFEFVGFDSTGGALEINDPAAVPLRFTKADDGKDVYIKGLKLKAGLRYIDPYLLYVRNEDDSSFLLLDEINLSDVKGGLYLSGERIDVLNSTIRGKGDGGAWTGSDDETCLMIRGREKNIKHSEFSNCYAGMTIKEASNSYIGATNETTFDTEANDIHDNKIGIRYIWAMGTLSPYNKIYNNVKVADNPSSDDVIFYDPAFYAVLEIFDPPMEPPKRPEIMLIDPATEQALHCDKDSSGRVVSRWLQFSPESIIVGQEVILYEVDNAYTRYQAQNYISKCIVNAAGRCEVIFPSSFAIDEDKCGFPSLLAVALINDTDYTSMLTPKRFKLDGPVVALGSDAAEIVDMIPAGGGMTGGGVAGSEVTIAESSSGGGGGEIGAKGATCTLIARPDKSNTVTSGLTMWWLIFAAPAVLVAVRIKKRK